MEGNWEMGPERQGRVLLPGPQGKASTSEHTSEREDDKSCITDVLAAVGKRLCQALGKKSYYQEALTAAQAGLPPGQ